MAGGKETPRQKMIGMMYLVLTALLALNVSKEILEAFVLVNNSLEKSMENAKVKNDLVYDAFAKAATINPKKVKPYYDKALESKDASNELVAYIQELKVKLIMETEGISKKQADTIHLDFVEKKDDYDTPTNIMVGTSDDGSNGEARKLKKKIKDYREKMMGLVPKKYLDQIQLGLETPNMVVHGEKMNWEMANFFHTPLAASVVVLSKLQNDIRNAEFDVVNKLFGEIGADDFPIDTVVAKVISPSNYVLLGEDYKSEVILAAFSKSQAPTMFLGEIDSTSGMLLASTSELPVENGMGRYSVTTDKEGIFTYSGAVKLKRKDGTITEFPFQSEYMVAKPSFTVSPIKMNVMYIGVDNPISVSVPGVPTENISVSISGGGNKLSRNGKGLYTATLARNSPRDIKVNVTATMSNGEKRTMGSMPFRVKRLPKPEGYVLGGNTGGRISKAELCKISLVKARYAPGFDFDLKANVVSYTLVISGEGGEIPKKIRGARLTAEAKTMICAARKGSRVYMEDIKAKGQDGVTHKLPDLIFKVGR
jgi:gliding motility-associated protein GldM